MEQKTKGAIFDLDGVVVDTAKYHYLAWDRLAGEMGFRLDSSVNERLKGVSRMDSLEIVLQAGGIGGIPQEEKLRLAQRKNGYYQEMIKEISPSELLPGTVEFIKKLKERNYKTALGSASKSGGLILKRLGIISLFDVVVDGNHVSRAKPDPEVFFTAADRMGIPYEDCVVIEDARAGVRAAHAGGMKCIGVGDRDVLAEADLVVENTAELSQIELIF